MSRQGEQGAAQAKWEAKMLEDLPANDWQTPVSQESQGKQANPSNPGKRIDLRLRCKSR